MHKDGASRLNRLHEDLLGTIFGKLWTGDRVRFRLVCKKWNRILNQSFIPIALEAPWEILSDDSYVHPESYITQVRLESLSEDRTYRFNLPFLDGLDDNRGWLLAHSRGWLVLAMGENMNPDVILWNPLSGATRKLPPLSTLSFFDDFQESTYIDVENFSYIICRVEVFSVGSVECVVAALFRTYRGIRIALCTPREETWTPYNIEPVDEETDEKININVVDVLFHTSTGKLMVLANESSSTKFVTEPDKFEISLMDCQIEVVLLTAPLDKDPVEVQNYSEFEIAGKIMKQWLMVESSISHDVLFISLNIEILMGSNDEEGTIPQIFGTKTNGYSLLLNQPIADAIFVGATGLFSLPVVHAIVPNCVYFATDYAFCFDDSMNPYIVRERGRYFLTQMMDRKYSHRIKYPPSSKIGWFLPRLLMM